MDAETKEMLREWLIRSLEPVCDADPEVLSKYVLALVQNNPTKEGLKETCVSKLEEFLGDETVGFVNRLFRTIENGSYKSEPEDGEEEAAPADPDASTEPDETPQGRRRTRSQDEEEDRRNFNKRRRDVEYEQDRRLSPRREAGGRGPRRDPNHGGQQRDMRTGRGGMMPGGRGDRERFGGMDRRRNFPPEWMPPRQMGMWPPHFPPPGGAFPPHPMAEFDPNAYNPETPGMMPPPPHMRMMMPQPLPNQFYPPRMGRAGGRGGRGRMGRGEEGGAGGSKDEEGGGVVHHRDDAEHQQQQQKRTTLRVSNVDPKYVNMTKLTLHFSKFGNVVNVQMRPNFKCAFVQYETEEEAKKAFHSPIPVCNNRFIEVKWAKYDPKDPLGAPSVAEQSAQESKDGTSGESSGKDAAEGGDGEASSSAPEKEMTAEELQAAALEKGRQVLEQKRELLEKQKQLMKQKEDLLKRQLAQQKEILERMSQSGANISIEDKRELLNKVSALSEELRALQRSNGIAPASGDFGNGESSRGGRGRGRGGRWGSTRGGYRGGRGGRGGGRASHTLDNRTTIVKIENLPEEARDSSVLEQHFGNFGAIEKVVVDESAPERAFIKFQDRYTAQSALTHGAVYGESKLEMQWVETTDAPPSMVAAAEASSTSPDTSEMPSMNEG